MAFAGEASAPAVKIGPKHTQQGQWLHFEIVGTYRESQATEYRKDGSKGPLKFFKSGRAVTKYGIPVRVDNEELTLHVEENYRGMVTEGGDASVVERTGTSMYWALRKAMAEKDIPDLAKGVVGAVRWVRTIDSEDGGNPATDWQAALKPAPSAFVQGADSDPFAQSASTAQSVPDRTPPPFRPAQPAPTDEPPF